jgi:hypothetical protein
MFIGEITRNGFRAASPRAGVDLRDALRTSPAVRLERLVEPSLLEEWVRAVDAAEFAIRTHKNPEYWGGKPPSDYKIVGDLLPGRFMFSTNDPPLLEIIETGADAGPIGSFLGVITRSTSSPDMHDRWHNDMTGTNVIALSLNLSRERYNGGQLLMRDVASGNILFEGTHGGTGDALLFRLSEELQHRVKPVDDGPARTVFTGWFRREPNFKDVMTAGARDL